MLCVLACGTGCEVFARARSVPITSDECYTLAYRPDDADPAMFPRALMFRAAADSGSVVATNAESSALFWGMFGVGARWHRLATDSLRIAFTNELSALDLVVAHDGSKLAGTAAFRFERAGEANPVLRVTGERVDCGP